MAEQFDVIVLGMGPGGEVAASRLLAAGKSVAVVERELIGGECAYWACIPSKTLLRPPEARAEAERAAGVARPDLAWPETRDYRDYMIRNLDDSGQIKGYEEQGATVLKGTGRLAGAGVVEVNGRQYHADHVVIATGSDTAVPPIEGLADVGAWTNREATTLKEIPDRVVMVGGSAVGAELGQFLRRFGAQVTIVQSADRLLNREDPRVSELTQGYLEADGIDVRVGRRVKRARKEAGVTVLELDDGTILTTDVVVLGTGRRPRIHGIGLETVGVEPDEQGLTIDGRCSVTEGVWALGDVTGVMAFTHVAMYQGRIVADNICGRSRTADYTGIPRVVFADPEIAAVGLHACQARQRGLDVAAAEVSLPDAIARPWTYEKDPRGNLGLVADRKTGLLIGAWAVAPQASEWIHQAAQAIRAHIPISTLLDGVAQFPTYSEGYLKALERLDL
ncbi:MAG: NAD(P)/FAD-dependent oxidoreductase [Nocardioidaceae bacterium]|nr:NAD(P)/FAD-dependent oxidoreductase [Nocardioidaceae bacterium]